jgi:hypothetical protein
LFNALVGEVYGFALKAVGCAKHDSVVVLEDREVLKAIVGHPNRFASVLEVCADLNIEFELHSAAEGGRCRLKVSQYWQNSQGSRRDLI